MIDEIINYVTSEQFVPMLMGWGMGGGNVAWAMWVTKYAPKDRTADYMSVHTFLTGTRGLIGPVIAFYLATQMPLEYFTNSCGALSFLSAMMLVPLMRTDDTGRGARSSS